MTQQKRTLDLLAEVKLIIREYDSRLTVRQLYYQLVTRQFIENNINEYKRLDAHLARFRKNRDLPLDTFDDRIRKPIGESSWENLNDFFETVKNAYRKNKRTNQKKYVEVWIEKDALSGIFEPITNYYNCLLLVGRGYQSISSLSEAAKRFSINNGYSSEEKKETVILYFGDYDATGIDIPRSAEQNLNKYFGIYPTFEKIGLLKENIEKYKLPSVPSKKTDSRSAAFILKCGNVAVELDALPPRVLERKIRESIVKHLDLKQFEKDKEIEEEEIK